MKALVSIIIPTYNRSQYICRSIESCVRQTYGDIEILVVDDCSSDDTPRLIAEYARKETRIRFIRHDTNKGLSAALNAGILNARGEFLDFLDDDCELLPEAIESEISLLRSLPDAISMLFSNIWANGGTNETTYRADKKDKLVDLHDIFEGEYWFPGQTTWFGRRSFFLKNMFDEALRNHMDMDFLLRIFLKGEKVFFYNKPLCINHEAEGISKISFEKISAKEAFLAKHIKALGAHKNYLSCLYCCLGKDSKILGDLRRTRKYFWLAFRTDPSIRYLLKFCASLFLFITKGGIKHGKTT